MSDIEFFSSLDTPDSVVLDVGSAFSICGWIFASNADIEAVHVECHDRRRYPASFPLNRPDVGNYYPDFDRAENCGFVTTPIPVEPGVDHHVEIRVIAVVDGSEHVALTREIRLLWSDPEKELFRLGAIGPFKFPDKFDEGHLLSYDNCAPVFLVGSESAMERALGVLEDHGCVVPKADLFLQMLDAIVECYDVYCEYYQAYFRHLESQFDAYAISRLRIYEVLNSIIAAFHSDSLTLQNGAGFVRALAGEKHVVLIPLLQTIYPNSTFIRVRECHSGIDPESSHPEIPKGDRQPEEAGVERGFEEKWRILQGGTRRFKFQEAELAGVASDSRAADHLLHLLGLSARIAGAGSGAAAELPVSASYFHETPPQGYLQAVPSFGEHRPIFVLGAGRSGTSAMTGALKAAGVAGFHEGHVFPLINEMVKRVWDIRSLQAGRDQSRTDMRARVVAIVVRTSFEQVYGDLDNQVWQDKTPDHLMIGCIPLIKTMFPRAKILFMRRHPIAYAESRRRKFGDSPLVAIAEWNKCIRSWNGYKNLLADSEYVECDASDLRGGQLHARLSGFLGLDEQSRRHFSDYLASQCPEMTRIAAGTELQREYAGLEDSRKFTFNTILFSLLDSLGVYIEDTDWDVDTIDQVEVSLGSLPEQLGYTVRRPKDMLVGMIIPLAKQLEEYRYTAEYHQKNARYREQQASKWKRWLRLLARFFCR